MCWIVCIFLRSHIPGWVVLGVERTRIGGRGLSCVGSSAFFCARIFQAGWFSAWRGQELEAEVCHVLDRLHFFALAYSRLGGSRRGEDKNWRPRFVMCWIVCIFLRSHIPGWVVLGVERTRIGGRGLSCVGSSAFFCARIFQAGWFSA